MNAVFARLFPLPFIAAGGAILYFGVKEMNNARTSESWPSVPGEVVASEVARHSSSDGGPTYSAEIFYEYEIDDTPYSSDRVVFGEVNSSNPSRAQKVVNRYPKGAEVTVFYNPENTDLAVLEPGIKGGTYFMPIFGLVFLTAGLGMFFLLPRAFGKKETKRRERLGDDADTPRGRGYRDRRGVFGETDDDDDDPDDQGSSGKVTWS